MSERYIEPYEADFESGRVADRVRAIFQTRTRRQNVSHPNLDRHRQSTQNLQHPSIPTTGSDLASRRSRSESSLSTNEQRPSPLPRKSSLPRNRWRESLTLERSRSFVDSSSFGSDSSSATNSTQSTVIMDLQEASHSPRMREIINNGVPISRKENQGDLGKVKAKAKFTFIPKLGSQKGRSVSSENISISQEKTALNNLQVLRQPKYKKREKSGRKIRQMEHLQRNKKCNNKLKSVEMEFLPNKYENHQILNVLHPIETSRSNPDLSFTPREEVSRIPRKENIYEEIKEAGPFRVKKSSHRTFHETELPPRPPHGTHQNLTLRRTPPKKVTFSTTDPKVHGRDEIRFHKKIVPGSLFGIAEVTTALRDKDDMERREIALLCYSAIARRDFNQGQSLGRIDTSRRDEEIFLILDKGAFEIRDADGLVIAKHRTHDISVITDVPQQSNVIAYIGRCKFSGRIGIVMKFTKPKYASMIIDLFRSGLGD